MRKASLAIASLSVCAAALLACAAEPPLKPGSVAPDFRLNDQNGRGHRLSSFRGKVVVLQFYPADMTGGCTRQARSLRDHSKRIARAGAKLFGVSVQDEKSKRAFCDKEGLTYTLLADTEKRVSAAYGVLLPSRLSARVTFIIDQEGKIARVMEKVNLDTHGADVLAAVRELEQATALAATQRKRR